MISLKSEAKLRMSVNNKDIIPMWQSYNLLISQKTTSNNASFVKARKGLWLCSCIFVQYCVVLSFF